jgi:hypothetical protein
MTYQHALRYLTQATEPSSASILLPLSHAKMEAAPLILCLGNDKQSRTVGEMLRSVLTQGGIDHLSYLNDDTLEAKLRFLHNGKPIPPPVLCRHAGDIRACELRLVKEAQADAALPVHERVAELLLRCASEFATRVILLECDKGLPLLRPVLARLHRAQTVAVLSDNTSDPQSIIGEGTKEVISPAGGQAMFRRISDACAKSGSRLTMVAAASCHRTDITSGSQVLHYRALHNCRILSAAESAARAGFLTLQTLSSLARYGLTVSEENVRVGMSRAELSHHCALWSISPLMLSDRIQNDKELAVSLHDLSALVPHLPSPRHLWLDDALTIHIPLPEWIDAVHDKDDTTIPSDASTCIVIGGDKFIQKIVAAAKKRQL